MFCPKCGNQMPNGAAFCGKCGAAVSAPAQSGAQAAPAAQRVIRAVPVAAAGSQAPIVASVSFLTMKNVGYIALGACVLGIIGFFLPIASLSAFGIGASMSAFQMVTGIEILGTSYGGDVSKLLIVIPYVVGLAVALGVKGKARWIVEIVCGALQLLFMIYFNAYISDNLGSYASLGIGYWLLTLGAVLLLAAGVLGLIGARKGLA